MTYLLVNFPLFHYDDPVTGLPARDWKVYTYEAGTVTPTETYINKECDILNTNPVILDYNGNAVIYTNKSLKIIISKPDDDQNTPHLTQDYLMVSQTDIVKATQGSMANNLYTVSSVPPQTALTDQMLLIFTPLTDSLTTTTSSTFVGTGENDLVWYGPYEGSTSGSVFTVEVLSNGTPDVVRWKKDGGAWTTVNITGSEQITTEGISFKFARTTGHTIGDLWALTVELPVQIALDGLDAKVAYENIAGDMVAVGAGMRIGFPCQFIYSTSQGAWVWVNPAAPSTVSPAPTRVRKEVAANYTIVLDDAGNEVAMTASGKTFTLPPAADFANQFVYLQAYGGVTVVIQADGSEKIYQPGDSTGATTMTLGTTFETVQLQSDSVGWHILTGVTYRLAIFAASGSWTSPITGNVFLTGAAHGGDGLASGTNKGGSAGECCIRFRISATAGTVYDIVIGATAGTDVTFTEHGGSTLLTLDGGDTGASATVDGEDALYGMGKGGIGASETDATGSAAGGYYHSASVGIGAPGFLLLEW